MHAVFGGIRRVCGEGGGGGGNLLYSTCLGKVVVILSKR